MEPEKQNACDCPVCTFRTDTGRLLVATLALDPAAELAMSVAVALHRGQRITKAQRRQVRSAVARLNGPNWMEYLDSADVAAWSSPESPAHIAQAVGGQLTFDGDFNRALCMLAVYLEVTAAEPTAPSQEATETEEAVA